MIVKKLRKQKNWSQDQLATMCGLSIRTIQRVESGQSASLETLKSLASVFEIEIIKLTEDIKVIDKKTENWKNLPLWFRVALFGVRARWGMILTELSNLVVGIVLWYKVPTHIFVPILFLIAYLVCCITRYADKKNIWP